MNPRPLPPELFAPRILISRLSPEAGTHVPLLICSGLQCGDRVLYNFTPFRFSADNEHFSPISLNTPLDAPSPIRLLPSKALVSNPVFVIPDKSWPQNTARQSRSPVPCERVKISPFFYDRAVRP